MIDDEIPKCCFEMGFVFEKRLQEAIDMPSPQISKVPSSPVSRTHSPVS